MSSFVLFSWVRTDYSMDASPCELGSKLGPLRLCLKSQTGSFVMFVRCSPTPMFGWVVNRNHPQPLPIENPWISHIHRYPPYPPCPMPWNFARRLLAPSVAGWCPRHCASQLERCSNKLEVWLQHTTTIYYDVYDWMVRIHIKCMKTWAFIQLQVPKIGFRDALECFAYVHLGSIVRRSRSPSSPIKVAAVTGGQECGKICLEPCDRFQLPSCQAAKHLCLSRSARTGVGLLDHDG